MTHLRHSSSFHRPPSLRCASVEPDRPGAYGAPGSSRRLSAYIIPAMNASCDPTSSARYACVCCVCCACGPCCCCYQMVVLPAPQLTTRPAQHTIRRCSSQPRSPSRPNRRSSRSRVARRCPTRMRTMRARIGRKAVASASRRTRCSRRCCRGPPPRCHSRFACSVPVLCRCVSDGGVGDGDDALRVG